MTKFLIKILLVPTKDWEFFEKLQETCLLRTEIPQGNARILCHPICSGEGDLEAVAEFVRTHGNAFTEDEIEVASKH